MRDLAETARGVIDSIVYLTLATVDLDGTPRASPVYFTMHRYTDVYWVSRPDTAHSRNLVRDGRIRAVVFDSTVPVGHAEAVYLTGRAVQIPDGELDDSCSVAFDSDRGGGVFSPDELRQPAGLRLYRLRVESAEALVRAGHPMLGDGSDRRVAVTLT